MKKVALCAFLLCESLSAFVFSGGAGAGYFAAYRTGDATLLYPFAPGLAVQIRFGLEGKDIGFKTRWRFGFGGSLNPLSSVGTGDLGLYAITVPLWFEYAVFRRDIFCVYLGFASGPGAGIFRDNIRRERANTVLQKTSATIKAEVRIFYPTSFWFEIAPGVLSEFTRAGVSSTVLPGVEAYVGFSNEY